jgi:hypothetical protein
MDPVETYRKWGLIEIKQGSPAIIRRLFLPADAKPAKRKAAATSRRPQHPYLTTTGYLGSFRQTYTGRT